MILFGEIERANGTMAPSPCLLSDTAKREERASEQTGTGMR